MPLGHSDRNVTEKSNITELKAREGRSIITACRLFVLP